MEESWTRTPSLVDAYAGSVFPCKMFWLVDVSLDSSFQHQQW